MTDNQKAPTLGEKQETRWQHYNYPPLLRVMHFVPSQIPQDRKFIVFSLFAIHIAALVTCLLNFIDNCIEGGLGILYSLMFVFIFNPIILFVFYRGFTGVCRDKSNLKMYIIIQPIVVVLEIVISIVDFLGFNGFVRVSSNFKAGRGAAGAIGLICSLTFLSMAGLSILVYIKIVRQKQTLTANLL